MLPSACALQVLLSPSQGQPPEQSSPGAPSPHCLHVPLTHFTLVPWHGQSLLQPSPI